jgi:hypothetical protein
MRLTGDRTEANQAEYYFDDGEWKQNEAGRRHQLDGTISSATGWGRFEQRAITHGTLWSRNWHSEIIPQLLEHFGENRD